MRRLRRCCVGCTKWRHRCCTPRSKLTGEADQVLSVSRGFGMTMDAGTADAWLLACGTVLYNASTEREELKEEA